MIAWTDPYGFELDRLCVLEDERAPVRRAPGLRYPNRTHEFWVELGRRGGAASPRTTLLSPERQSEIGRNAARARWGKARGK